MAASGSRIGLCVADLDRSLRFSCDGLGFDAQAEYVDDVDETLATLVECGGTLVESTRTVNETGEIVFVADPDGTRIELMKLAQ